MNRASIPYFIREGINAYSFFDLMEQNLNKLLSEEENRLKEKSYLINASFQAIISKNDIETIYELIFRFMYLYYDDIDNSNSLKFEMLESFVKTKIDNISSQTLSIDQNYINFVKDFFNNVDCNDFYEICNFQSYMDDLKAILVSISTSLVNFLIEPFSKNEILKIAAERYNKFESYVETLQNQSILNTEDFFLKFLLIKRSFDDYISNVFIEFQDVFALNSRKSKLLMLPTFFEYILLHNVKDNSRQDFHCVQKNSNADPLELIQHNFVEAKEIEVKFEFIDGYNYLIYPDEKIPFYNDFKITCLLNSTKDIMYVANNEENPPKQIIYHEKKIGNVSNGFWIELGEGGKRYYFKELYCTSHTYDKYVCDMLSAIKGNKINISSINSTVIQSNPQLPNFVDKKTESIINYNPILSAIYNYCLDDPDYIAEASDFKRNYYYLNKYVELSGYFVLDLLQKAPKVDAFFSCAYNKPIIYVEGIPPDYQILEESENVIDLSNICNDICSILISSIPVMSLQVIKRIFLLDDFHPGNLAAKIVRKQYNNETIEFIEDIKIIDLWPATFVSEDRYLIGPNDVPDLSKATFEDIMLERVDIIGKKKLLINEVATKFPIFPPNVEETQRKRLSQRMEVLNNMNVNDKKLFYGDRIVDFIRNAMWAENLRPVLVFYAVDDLFRDAYSYYLEKYGPIKKDICINVASKVINECYIKATEETKVLHPLPNINQTFFMNLKYPLEIDAKEPQMWLKYLGHISNSIKSLIDSLTIFIDSKNYYLSSFRIYCLEFVEINDNAKLKTKVIAKKPTIIKSALTNDKSMGIVFSKSSKDIDIAKDFGIDIDHIEETSNFIINEFKSINKKKINAQAVDILPHIYSISSPFLFDIVMQILVQGRKRIASKKYPDLFYNLLVKS